MDILAHVTAQETPLWILMLLLGISLGITLTITIIARINRDRTR